MINIVFSTTRQFNPGDEFILYGIMNLLQDVMESETFNPVIYNRNPDINQKFDSIFTRTSFNNKIFRGSSYASSFLRMFRWDNSIRKDSKWENIDLVVFAGSPEWYGDRSRIVYRAVEKYKIPVAYIGIGTGEEKIEEKLRKYEWKVLNRALYIVTRDQMTSDMFHLYANKSKGAKGDKELKTADAKCVPCPSICSSRTHKKIKEIKKVALIYSSSRVSNNNNISVETENYIKHLYPILMEKYNTALVCHYIEELDYIAEDFPKQEYYYSFDSHDYFKIYSQFDFVIGCRVHGIGICASMGIPGVIIKHSIRCETSKMLGADMLIPDLDNLDAGVKYVVSCIENATAKSIALAELKKETQSTYLSDLKYVLSEAGILRADMKNEKLNTFRGGVLVYLIRKQLPDMRREVLYG